MKRKTPFYILAVVGALAIAATAFQVFWLPLFRKVYEPPQPIVIERTCQERIESAMSTRSHSEIDAAIETLVNRERQKVKAPALIHSECLDTAALVRAKEIVTSGKFSHTRPNGSKFAYGDGLWCEPATNRGENLAMDFTSIEGVVAAWLASPAHHDLMLNDRMTRFGTAQYENVTVLEVSN